MLQSFWTNFVGTQSLQMFCVFFEKVGLDEEVCEEGLHQLGVSNRALEKKTFCHQNTSGWKGTKWAPETPVISNSLRKNHKNSRKPERTVKIPYESIYLFISEVTCWPLGSKLDHILYNVQLLKVGLVRGHGKWWQTLELKLNHLVSS